GRVVFTNTYRSEIVAWDPQQGVRQYAYTGGAPNACLLGSDGHVYIANCPTAGIWVAPDRRPACIQRATPAGKVEIIATSADGVPLDGANDLCFGPDGRIYFTDSGDYAPQTRHHPGRVCVLAHNGTAHILEELDHTYPNGIVAETDGAIVWVESYTRRMIRRRPDGTKTVIHTFPDGHIPDGFKIDAHGNFWVTTVTSGGIDIVSRDGAALDFLALDAVPLNCIFDGTSLYVADFGQADPADVAPMVGRLLRVDVGVRGMPLFSGAVS
ncbi:MAG TPA: SMP-30/gluconolactonase/LRE family protein, partial [Methylomirabilota bacterium]|nr:SMP-30/gluconolactonase/LRE family protein [Methylomirabilota bacterium]